jgi:hypothetical protein
VHGHAAALASQHPEERDTRPFRHACRFHLSTIGALTEGYTYDAEVRALPRVLGPFSCFSVPTRYSSDARLSRRCFMLLSSPGWRPGTAGKGSSPTSAATVLAAVPALAPSSAALRSIPLPGSPGCPPCRTAAVQHTGRRWSWLGSDRDERGSAAGLFYTLTHTEISQRGGSSDEEEVIYVYVVSYCSLRECMRWLGGKTRSGPHTAPRCPPYMPPGAPHAAREGGHHTCLA